MMSHNPRTKQVTKFSRRDADYEAKWFGSWGNQVPANGGTDPFVPSQQPIDNKNEDDLDWRQNLGRSEQSRPRIAPEDYFVVGWVGGLVVQIREIEV
ncbi:hypothetical protein BC936DRAFT_148630 [Jimgerdemannia flammicorona]|uniref:Uncharacterized protein n=1 Tax=Jimgerdemannia flammicorona TaxID=994334 RepID=A0A433DKL7_9FUNG|nr:hypothetical protein BC936DRAFT_148630 [Jimgerdemannia flammicorona]